MKAGIGISISVGLALILAGCGHGTTLSGMWKGDRDWKALGLDSEAVARAIAAVNLNLKSDGSFVLQDGGIPYTGSWTQSGSDVNLKVETILNRPVVLQQESIQMQTDFKLHVVGGRIFFKSPADTKEFELKKETATPRKGVS